MAASLKAALVRAHPDFPWLDPGDAARTEQFLRARGWLAADERVAAVEPAGAGNMNCTLRVRTDRRSVILKQARPWVERYEHIAAPWERSVFERRFYERVAAIPAVAARMPRLLAAADDAHALLLEDLGAARDMSDVYGGTALAGADLTALGAWLGALHAATRGAADPALANRAMRALNHAHVFVIPFGGDAGVDCDALEPGLAAAATSLRADATLRRKVEHAGARYLADGPCLLHGDFFPGSWLRTDDGVRVIDPEFAFYGVPEIDLGCAVGHLALARMAGATVGALLAAYGTAAAEGEGAAPAPDPAWIARFAGIEVIRRLIGVAQLPLPARAGARAALLARAHAAVLADRVERLWA